MTGSSHIQPRRRAAAGSGLSVNASSTAQPTPCLRSHDLGLRKGSTFHSPSSPSDPQVDPTLNIGSLPSRTLTCPKTLEELVAASDKRVADLLATFERSFSGLGQSSEPDYDHKDVLPVPASFLTHVTHHSSLMDAKESKTAQRRTAHRHGSDSGLGTSVSTSPRQRATSLSEVSVYSAISQTERGQSSSNSTEKPTNAAHCLSEFAAKKIELYVLEPLLEKESLKEFHPLVKSLPSRIADQKITCLRDLEKTLVFLAPTKAKSPKTYLAFCESTIQCLHTAVGHLSEIDQRRPADRPYTNHYFVDLVEQVRAYARIMAMSRQKKAKGEKLDEMDHVPGEKIDLRGGLAEDGKPVELVREKEGRIIKIEGGEKVLEHVEDDEDIDELMDDDVARAMARKRKCDIGKVEYRACRECGKVYTRPCDLTKHEKTHSRPWKCTFPDCKYFEFGWPTEKERDRHVNDKHMAAPDLYKCLFKPCAYTSKRESNCKQHMEKAHNWEYVRSKSKKGEKLVPTRQNQPTSLVPTPSPTSALGSDFQSLSPPVTLTNDSPVVTNSDAFSPVESMNAATTLFGYDAQSNINLTPSYSYGAFDGQGALSNNMDLGGDYSSGLQMDNAFLSPEMSEGRRGSFGTSGAGMTPESASSSMPTTGFEDTFNFNEFTFTWPPMGEHFPIYNIPPGAQQPTPAWSEYEDFTKPGNAHPEISPVGQLDAMFGAPTGHSGGDEMFADFAQAKPGQSSNDFTLFGSNGESSADGAAMGQMFPDIGSVGAAFDDDAIEAYLYGNNSQ